MDLTDTIKATIKKLEDHAQDYEDMVNNGVNPNYTEEYRGKKKAYSYAAVLLRRDLEWHKDE